MIEDTGIYFPNVVPHCDPPRPPMVPAPNPNFTIQEQFLDTTRRVNETLNRVLRMEASFKATYEEYAKNLTADNVAFKDLCMVTYNQFAERVRTEINTFEGDITNAYNAFAESVKQDISAQVAAADVLAHSVDERITAFETSMTGALTEYKAEVNTMLDSFRSTTDARIDQYNVNHEQAFNNYVTEMNARFASFEGDMETRFNAYTQETSADIANHKTYVEGRLDGQNQTITDAVHYMKTNLQNYVTQIVDEMEESGELYAVMGERMGIVTPEMYGAKGDGVTDDSEAIQAMINAAQPFETVYFNNKTYAIATGIVVDKKVNINGRYGTLKAIADIPYCITFTGHGSLKASYICDLNVDCDSKATVGFEIGDNNHTTQTTFERCSAINAKTHGFMVNPIAYCLTFNRCRAMYNGHSGFYAVGVVVEVDGKTESRQVNAIYFDGCTAQHNTENGFKVNGVNIIIKECNGETNKYGVYVGGENYPTYGTIIRGGYFEQNQLAQVCLNGSVLTHAIITENYFYSTKTDESGKTVHIKCIGGADKVMLYYSNNYSYGENRVDVEGGGVLNRDSYVNAQYTANTRFAALGYVPPQGFRMYFPVSLSGGTPCQTGKPSESVNMVSDTTKNVCFAIPSVLVHKLVRMIGCHITTDGTTATVRAAITVKDVNGVQVKRTHFDFTVNESKVYAGNCMNNMGFYNIPADHIVELEYTLTDAGNASSVVIARPYIDIYG